MALSPAGFSILCVLEAVLVPNPGHPSPSVAVVAAATAVAVAAAAAGAWCVAARHSVYPYFCTLGLGCEPGIGAEADLTGNSSLITAVTDFNSVLKALSEEHGAPAAARAGAASDADEGAGTKKKRKGTLADSRVTFRKRAVAKDISRYSAIDKAAIFMRAPGSIEDPIAAASGSTWGSVAAVTADRASDPEEEEEEAGAGVGSGAGSEDPSAEVGEGEAGDVSDKKARKRAKKERKAKKEAKKEEKRKRKEAKAV